MAAAVARSIDRKSSIETEPRTLDIHQIHFAREAALYVMSTKTIEEAMLIFTEGLEPVVSPTTSVERENEFISMEIEGDDSDEEQDELTVSKSEKLRDVFTAPF